MCGTVAGMQTTDAAALAAIDGARARVGRMMAELSDVRRRAGHVDDDTRWSARAADRYRARLEQWRDALRTAAAELEVLDGELHVLAIRIEASLAAAATS